MSNKPTLRQILNDFEWRDGERRLNQVETEQQLTTLLADIIGESQPIPPLKDTSIDSIIERSVRVGMEKLLDIQRQRAREAGIDL